MTCKKHDDLIQQARIFATAAHAAIGQKRKYTEEPYFYHAAEVAHLVAEHTNNDPVMVAAAWLHDVLEDTHVEATLIDALFGKEVADLVVGLTKVVKPEDGNREQRVGVELERLARQSPNCKTVKLADVVSNCSSIASHDPKFARVYLTEKRDLLDALQEGDKQLLALAHETIESGMKVLGMDFIPW